MVVIAGLIGGQGLGDVVTSGLYSNPALRRSLAGGAIVVMAIALDRVHRGDGESHRPDAAPPDRRASAAGCACTRSPVRRASGSPSGSAICSAPRSSWTHRTHRGLAAQRRCRACSTTSRTRRRSSSTSRARSGTSSCSTSSRRCSNFFVQTPWPAMVFGLAGIAFFISGLRPAVTTLADAPDDRRHQRVGAGDGHALAGARRDRSSRCSSGSRSVSGPPRARACARRCDPCSTSCKRCRSSSTSSRSST